MFDGRHRRPDDRELVSIVEQEVARSVGHWDGDLSNQRKKEIDYYLGRPFGNEMEGESQVVSSDVSDTIEGILPAILRIFTSSDDAVRFDPQGPEDEDAAAQRTDVCNYVFYRQNNGFLILYEWMKDALLNKNGIVKYWWEDKDETTKEEYEGLTEGEYQTLFRPKDGSKVEELEHNAYDDPAAIERKDAILKQVQQMPPEQQQQTMAQLNAAPLPQLHDVKVRLTRDVSKICIQAIPPEEFGISATHHCVSVQEAPFCYHRSRQSKSSLREAGCPQEILDRCNSLPERDTTPESIARDRFLDSQWVDTSEIDQSTREVWVTECFIRLDWDGDGIAELRHIIMPDREIWINEESEHINFACITPIIMPHRWVGRSLAELVMDIQFQKSTLWRQMLNNLYLTNNPQKAVLSTAGGIVQANLDDLLTSRPGGIVREYVPNAVRPIETPFVAAASFPMMEYLDGVKENRTGNTRYNQGTDADSLNKTARGIAQIMAAGQQRLDLIARIFAETGVKDLFKGISYILSKYATKAMTIKLRNKWVQVDPREWKTQFDMTINVGLGTGNRDVQLAHLQKMHEQQIELMQTGKGYMVTDENIWNLYRKTSEAMGFKHPEMFVTDPENIDPKAKQPPPDPAAMKVHAESIVDAEKIKFGHWKEQLNAETLKSIEQMKAQALVTIAQMDNETKKQIAAAQSEAEARLLVFKQNHDHQSGLVGTDQRDRDYEIWKAKLEAATKIEVAEISKATALAQAQISAANAAASSTQQ